MQCANAAPITIIKLNLRKYTVNSDPQKKWISLLLKNSMVYKHYIIMLLNHLLSQELSPKFCGNKST